MSLSKVCMLQNRISQNELVLKYTKQCKKIEPHHVVHALLYVLETKRYSVLVKKKRKKLVTMQITT